MVFVCLQSILKYWTTNSYILCAMYGENLFNTLSQANSQIFRNSLRFLAFTEVTDLFINVNIVGVVLMNLGVTFIIFPIQMDKVESQVVVYVLIAVITFGVTKSFFMVYQMACKTIFICFLEDERGNDGSKSRPYAMSVKLFQLLTTIQKKRRPKKKAIMSNDEKTDFTMEKLPQSTTRQTTNLADLVMTIVRTKRKVRCHKNRKYVSAIRSKTFESKF